MFGKKKKKSTLLSTTLNHFISLCIWKAAPETDDNCGKGANFEAKCSTVPDVSKRSDMILLRAFFSHMRLKVLSCLLSIAKWSENLQSPVETHIRSGQSWNIILKISVIPRDEAWNWIDLLRRKYCVRLPSVSWIFEQACLNNSTAQWCWYFASRSRLIKLGASSENQGDREVSNWLNAKNESI